jgi:putative MATE family efflux protein
MRDPKFFEEEKISALLLKFSVPAVAGMMVGALYNIVDGIFVARFVGPMALGAVTLVTPIMLFLMAIGMLIGVGSSNLVSISLGEKNRDKAELILGNAFSLVIALVVLVSGTAYLFLDDLLVGFLGATPEILPLARSFTVPLLLGSVLLHVGFGLNNIVRAQGNPKTAFATQGMAAVVNCGFNYLFLGVFGMGIEGAAYATVLAQGTAAIWVLICFNRRNSLLRLRLRNLSLRPAIAAEILKIGSAPFLVHCGATAIMVVLNWRIMAYGGEMGVAAYGVVNRVLMFILMPIFGICHGMQPIVGYSFGAKLYERLIEALKKASIAAGLFSLACFLFIEIWPEPIVYLFNDDPVLVHRASEGLRIFLLLTPVVGPQIVGAQFFQAIGKPFYAIFLSLSRQILLLIPLVFLLSCWFGLRGVWAAGPLSDLVSAGLTFVLITKTVRKYKKQASLTE